MEKLICKRAIRRMNKELSSSCLYGSDDFPKKFNAFDILSVRIQSMGMEDINPKLEDYISDILEDEADKAGIGFEGLYEVFLKMLDEHYYIKKIQKFVNRY